MKRILSIALCLILVFSLCACGGKTDKAPAEPIEGRWLYRAHAFIQVLTISEDTIERQYMTYPPDDIPYTITNSYTENDTKHYELSVTEGELTYTTDITVTGDKLVWEGMEYRRLAKDEEVDFTFTEDEIQDMFFSDNEIVQLDPETGKPVEDEKPAEDEAVKEPVEEQQPETPAEPIADPLTGLWRHENGDFVLEFNFTDGKKYEYYKDDRDFYTTYKIISSAENADGSTTLQIEETDEGLVIPVKIILQGDTLKYGEDETLFTKVQ